jgi:hypothetical protein
MLMLRSKPVLPIVNIVCTRKLPVKNDGKILSSAYNRLSLKSLMKKHKKLKQFFIFD